MKLAARGKLEGAAPARPCEVDVIASSEEEARAKIEDLFLGRSGVPLIARVRVGASVRTVRLGFLSHEEALRQLK